MTDKVTAIYQHPAIRKDIADAMIELNHKIADAINDADDAGVPLIMISTVLYAQMQLNMTIALEPEE